MQFMFVLLILNIGLVYCIPNNVKTVQSNEIPAISIGPGGVSASWGGYSAKAGLGGNTGLNGGLFASADSPHGNAAAGLGGNVGAGESGFLGAQASSPYGGSAAAGLGGNVGVGDATSGALGASASSPYGGSAVAGLGGNVGVGDATSGALGASASSPYGGSAAAGLGGNTGLRGGLYATADSAHGNAAAGLGGNVGAGESGFLGASASSPHGGSAAAGIGGNTNAGTTYVKQVTINAGSSANSHASAGVGGSIGSAYGHSGGTPGTDSFGSHTQVTYNNNHQQPGLFDNIFNIPISVLQSVNGYLNQHQHQNQGGQFTKVVRVHGRGGHGHRRRGPALDNRSTFTQNVNTANSAASFESYPMTQHVPSDAAVNTAGHGGVVGSAGTTVVLQKKPVNFDNIFNIPISTLRAVNKLLNDGAASVNKNLNVQVMAQKTHSFGGGAQVSHVQGTGAQAHGVNTHVAQINAVPNTASASASATTHFQVEQGNIQPQALTAQKPDGLYNNVFNIPITALKSVNQLLNG